MMPKTSDADVAGNCTLPVCSLPNAIHLPAGSSRPCAGTVCLLSDAAPCLLLETV